MESVFMERNHSIAIRPCFDYLSRDDSGGSSAIGYHLPQSVSVFVRELFGRSADQLVVAQPGANASGWERIFGGSTTQVMTYFRSTSVMATCASTCV